VIPPLTSATGPLHAADADVLAVLVPSDEGARAAALAPLAEGLGVDLEAALRAVDVSGEAGQVARVPAGGRLVLVVGTGAPADGRPGVVLADDALEARRRAAGAAVRAAPKGARVALAGGDDPAQVRAVAEGAALGAYAYTEHRRKPHEAPSVAGLTVVTDVDGAADVLAGVQVVVDAVLAARDMVNTPPSDKRPPVLAERMAALVEGRGVTATVWDDDRLRAEGFGGILGVGIGSSAPPRMVELVYEPDGWDRHVALIGKGITFDSGGLSLKTWKGMTTMKSDMSGAAAVAAVMSALQGLGVTAKVTGLCALAENMPSGTATRPSDVLVHRGGTTVEVLNTDAEGRLVMADALAYAAEQQPDAMVDIATLTGAQIVALGDDVAAVLGTDDALVEALRAAGRRAGEQLWPLPLVDRYAKTLESTVADLSNIGKAGHAGTITAALFLRRFTAEVPWAHLDIAGPAFVESADDGYLSAGGTGFGVRTLLAWLAEPR
jgi:leucyl aminopeptidase